jgi:amidase
MRFTTVGQRLRRPESRTAAAVFSLQLIASAADVTAATPSAPGAAELTVAEVRQELASGRLTVVQLEELYASRIDALDRHGPTLRSVLEFNPDAAAIARGLDHSGRPGKGLLFGVPVLLKDNIDTDDRMHTTAGSLALLGSRPAKDAFIVQRLRAAGALVLGKTNLSEWANFRSTRSSSGWSGRGGQTRNPYVLDRNPCGSSAGSGVAVAADLTVVAIGTETNGSIVCPASVNGVVGLKPTVGLVSRSGIIPIAASQDTAGPMTRTVADAAAVLTVIAGYDPDDPATAAVRDHAPPDYFALLKPDALQGARIGVLRKNAGFHEAVDVVFEHALVVLKERGATLIDAELPDDEAQQKDRQTLLQCEFKDGLNRYLATRAGPGPRTLAEVIAFNETHATEEMPYFRQERMVESEACAGLSDPKYLDVRDRLKKQAQDAIDQALAKDKLDALVAPTMGPAWSIDLVNGGHGTGSGISTPPALAGYPHLTLPMGAVEGLPVGLSWIGTAWSEGRLLSFAYAFEQATHARQRPRFLPTLPDHR